MDAIYRCEQVEQGCVRATSPDLATPEEGARWAAAQGDGSYVLNMVGDGGRSVWFDVRAGAIVPRSDWARVLEAAARLPRLPFRTDTTLWVIRPGNLSAKACLHEPGICLSRAPLPGDTILDVLTVHTTEDGLEVTSRRQRDTADGWRWTERGPVWEHDRDTFDRVSISGRADSWGSLGDDSYDDAAADYLLEGILVDAVFEIEDWRLARVYYEARETAMDSADGREYSPYDPVVRVRLADRISWPAALGGWTELLALADEGRTEDEALALAVSSKGGDRPAEAH